MRLRRVGGLMGWAIGSVARNAVGWIGRESLRSLRWFVCFVVKSEGRAGWEAREAGWLHWRGERNRFAAHPKGPEPAHFRERAPIVVMLEKHARRRI